MIRLLGAITGSALALATLLVFVGVPHFKFDPAETDDNEQAVVTLPLPTRPVEQSAAPTPSARESAPAAPDPVAASETPAETATAQEVVTPASLPEPVATEPAPTNIVEQPEPESIGWYAFWSPFRSEIAATGFVDQLERVTGLDYRVVRIKPGVYEVAFAYSDDTEIAGNLSRITAATGLEMPEG